ncbi:MAG: glycosyltransferase [Planctomycetes bacterium]|nr:glycosyltransferase [Planctomycetota bacterium]
MSTSSTPLRARRIVRPFDGIVAFGSYDGRRHHRGSYEFRLLDQLAAQVPLLYVDDFGIRAPTDGGATSLATCIARCLAAPFRRASKVKANLAVLHARSSPAIPGGTAARIVAARIRRAMRELRIRRPLVWVANPLARTCIDALEPAGVVFLRTDLWEEFGHADFSAVTDAIAWLRHRADIVVYRSRELMVVEGGPTTASSAYWIEPGVDLPRLSAAGDSPVEPAGLRDVPRPRVGFAGDVEPHSFDVGLFTGVARRLPGFTFVIAGTCRVPADRLAAPNVRLVGPLRPDDVAKWLAACDAVFLPQKRGTWLRACHPVLLKEALAVGRPVVSTEFPELSAYRGLVRAGGDEATLAALVRDACFEPHDPRPGRAAVDGQGWEVRARQVLHALDVRGLVLAGSSTN